MSKQGSMLYNFVHHTVWDFIIYRGIIALILGILFIVVPGITISTMCMLLGIFLILNGLAALVKCMKESNNKKILFIYGLIFLLAGILILIYPIVVQRLLVILFSLWIIISGGNQLTAAWKAKAHPTIARILTDMAGVISIILGLALLVFPDIGLNIIVMIIGIYFLVFGVLAVSIGSVIHKANRKASTIIG